MEAQLSSTEVRVSSRAMRSALRIMCRIAHNYDTIRCGLRASKLAELCEYSVATTIHRAECYLIEHGYIERVRKGGGRLSTRWRIVVDKLAPADAKPLEPAKPPECVNAPEKPHFTFAQVVTLWAYHGAEGGGVGVICFPRPASEPTWRAPGAPPGIHRLSRQQCCPLLVPSNRRRFSPVMQRGPH